MLWGEQGTHFPRNANTGRVTPHPSSYSSLFVSLSFYLLSLLSLSIPPFTGSSVSHLHLSDMLLTLPSPLVHALSPSPAIGGSHAGQEAPQPERLITFLPPAVHTSVLAATPIHYLPWSRAAHSSPLSATSSFVISLNPQPWRSMAAQQDMLAINQKEGRAQRFSSESDCRDRLLLFCLVGTCL